MRKLKLKYFLSIAVSLLFVCNLRADMVIAISDGNLSSYVAGSINLVDVSSGPGTVRLSVWAYDTAPAGRQFNGFNLGLDLSPLTNISIPSNFTGFSVSNPVAPLNNGNFNIDLIRPNRLNYDFLVNASGGIVTLLGVTSPVKLFDLSFTASPSTPMGLYDLRFVPLASDSAFFGPVQISAVSFVGGGGSPTLNFAGGQFQAVPEPTSLALLGIIGTGFIARRWSRKKRSA